MFIASGLFYASDAGRQIAGALTAILNGVSYATSAEMAGALGAFPGFKIFFFKQKTAYEIGLGIPAEPLFRSAWERAGADASSAGMVDAGFENQKELTKMQLDNQKEIAEMQNETQKEIAGIQSATSRQNTKDQVYAQNEMLAYQQKESTAR